MEPPAQLETRHHPDNPVVKKAGEAVEVESKPPSMRAVAEPARKTLLLGAQ